MWGNEPIAGTPAGTRIPRTRIHQFSVDGPVEGLLTAVPRLATSPLSPANERKTPQVRSEQSITT